MLTNQIVLWSAIACRRAPSAGANTCTSSGAGGVVTWSSCRRASPTTTGSSVATACGGFRLHLLYLYPCSCFVVEAAAAVHTIATGRTFCC